jgi:autotransporter-associated beta strand protein
MNTSKLLTDVLSTRTSIQLKSARSLSLGLTACLTAGQLIASDIFKNNTQGNLTNTTVWAGGVVPGTNDVAVFDTGVTGSALTNALGANLAWKGIRIANPGGTVMVTNGNTLTNGIAGFDLSAASQDLTMGASVVYSPGVQHWNVGTGRTLYMAGGWNKPTDANFGQPAVIVVGTGGGTVKLANSTIGTNCVLDAQGNPYMTVGLNDWAAIDANSNVVAATYTDYSTSLGTGFFSNANVTASFTQTGNGTLNSLRFADSVNADVLTIASGTTFTPKGILVAQTCAGGQIIGAGNIRPQRSNMALPAGFNVIQNCPNPFLIGISIGNGSSNVRVTLIKSGPGSLVMTNGTSGYAGGTVVNEGSLTFTSGASLGSGSTNTFGTNVPAVVYGGRLVLETGPKARPLTNGLVSVQNAGTNSVKVVAANDQLNVWTVSFNGVTHQEFNYGTITPSTTVPPLAASNLNAVGTVTVDVYGYGFAPGVYPLVKVTNSASLAASYPSFLLGTLPPRVNGVLSNDTANSQIDLVVTSVTGPIVWATTSGTWQVGGPSIWVDSTLASTTYQESTSPYGPIGDAVKFDDSSSGSSSSVTINTTVSPDATLVSAAKNFSMSGSGSIGGIGALTKSGSGTLTLSTGNSFSGGVNFNGGIVNFSALNNLGTGPLTFNGGTLQYASGNTVDISVRPITLAVGGATLDTGANSITLTNPLGTFPGGLTKTGAGTLTLPAGELYFGATVINQGKLAVGGQALTNSAAIVLQNNSTLDATSGGGFTLANNANQVLAGTGTVEDSTFATFTTPNSAISPGTNGVLGTLTFNGDLHIAGGTIYMDLSTTGNDLLIDANGSGSSALYFDAPTTLQLNFLNTLTNGVYKIMQYVNKSGSAAVQLALTGSTQPGKSVAISEAIPGEIDIVVSTSASDTLTWSGAGANWDNTTANWLKGGTPWIYTNGDFVTFDETGNAQPNVSLQGAFSPGSITFNNSATPYSLNDGTGLGQGKLDGPAGIKMTGTGSVTVNTMNTSFGPTVISSGTLQVNGDLGSGNVTNNGTLIFQQSADETFPGSIAGTGSFTQNGSAFLTLAGKLTYTGPTTNGFSQLIVGTGGAAGPMSSSAIVNNGFLTFNSGTSWTYSGPVSGTGQLTKAGTNTLNLAGLNSYTGQTIVSNGILRGVLPFAQLSVFGGRYDLNGGDLVPNGFGAAGPATGGLLVNNTTLNVTNTITFGTNNTAADFAGAINDNDGGSAHGKIAVLKLGAGTLTLRTNNNYSGGTHVAGGTLQVASSAVQIAGPILMDNGTTFDLFQQGGSPNFTGNLTLAPGSTVSMDCNTLGNNYAGTIIGDPASTLNIINPLSFGASATNQLQPFPGTVHLVAPATLRFSATGGLANGGDNTTFVVDTNTTLQTRNAGEVSLGALFGQGFVGGDQLTNGGAATYTIGLKNINSTFSGTLTGINDPSTTAGNETASIVKMGTATLTLDGTLLYDGQTTVSNGILALGSSTNNQTALTNSSGYQISAGGTLNLSATVGGVMNGTLTLDNLTNTAGNFVTNQWISGSGTLVGNLASLFGRVYPGDGIGNLTVNGNATLAGIMLMELNVTNANLNDKLSVSGTLNLAGCALTVTNLGPGITNGTTFRLFNKAITGALASEILPNTPTYVWTDNLHSDGTITLASGGLSAVNTNPTNIVFAVTGGGNTLSLTWPTDHLGWTLAVQTNNLAGGISGNTNDWYRIPGSSGMTSTNIPIDHSKPATFYRLVYP